MALIRQDYLTGNHVLIAEDRANRPQHFRLQKTEISVPQENCPFCPGNEKLMTEILFETPDRHIRIIPNKYPAIGGESGLHEVIIETSDHFQKFHELSENEIFKLFIVMRNRLKEIYHRSDIQYIQVFKNQGNPAGASIPHSHWQLIGLPFVPQRINHIHNNFTQYYNENGIPYLREVTGRTELIFAEKDTFFAYSPFAPLFSYGIQIAPKINVSHYHNLTENSLNDLAILTKQSLQALNHIFPDISYNICFMDAPKGNYPHSHFFVEIIPRSGTMAGFEFATECFINPFPPEKIAAELKDIITKKIS